MERTGGKLKYNERMQLIGVSVGHFTNDFFVGIIAPISLYFALKLNLNLMQQGLISIVVLVFASFFQPMFGLISDKVGKPKHLIFSVIWISLWISLAGIINNFYILLAVLAIGSSASAFYHPLGSTAAVAIGGKSKGTSLSVFMTVGGFSATAASIAGLWVAQRYGLNNIVYFAIPGCLVAILMFVLRTQNIDIKSDENQIESKGKTGKKLKLSGKQLAWLLVLIYISLIKVLCGRFIVTYGIQILSLKSFTWGAALLSLHLFARPIGTMTGGILLDRIGEKRVFTIGMLITLISLSMVGLGGSYIAAAGVALIGFSISLTNTAGVLVSHEIITDSQSFATGIILGIPGGIGSLSMMIFSGIADVSGLVYATRMMIVPLVIATILTYFLVYKRK